MKFIWFALFLALSLRAADPISLINSNGVKICAECGKPVSIRLLVAVAAKTDPTATHLDLADVEVDGTHDADVFNAFAKPQWEIEGGQIVALKLDVSNPAPLKKQGTYTVFVRVESRAKDAFYLKPQLLHAPASIDPPGTITIDRVFGLGWDPKIPQLQLAPKTPDAGLTEILIRQAKPPAGSNGATIGGSVAFQVPNSSIAVGQAGNLGILLQGPFPFGKSTGQAEIAAPQLSAPVQFNYEVVSRLHPLWILPVALIGVYLGLLLRVVLQGRIELHKAQIAGGELQNRVAADLAEKHDEEFRTALKRPLKDLVDSLPSGDAATISKATQDLDTAWRAQLKDLTDRVAVASAAVEVFSATTIQSRWPKIASKVQAVLDAAPVEHLRKLIRDSNAHEAQQALAVAWAALEGGLDVARHEWIRDFKAQADLLSGVQATGISAADRRMYKDNVAGVTGKWAAFTAPDKDSVGTFLRDAHSEAEGADDLLHGLANSIQAEWTLTRSRIPEDARLGDVGRRTEDFAKQLSIAYRDPSALPKQADLDALRDAWLGFLLANASPEAAAGVKKSIQDGDFVEAVNIAFTLQRPELDALVVPQPPLSRRPQLPISALDIHIASRPVELPDPAGLQIPRTRAQLARDQAMLTTSVAILYSVIALLTFGPKFVGDIYECGAILLWGVGLDFTLDAAVKSIPKKA